MDAVLIRPCWNTGSGRTCRDTVPCWPVWDAVPSDADYVVLVDPDGTLSSSSLVGIMVSDVSVELLSLIGPVQTLGELSLSDSDGSTGP